MIRLLVEGQKEQVENFVRSFQKVRDYRICDRTYLESEHPTFDNVRMDLTVVNSKPKKRMQEIELVTKGGSSIRFCLLDAKVVRLNDTHTLIYGKHYDIF